MGTRRYVSGPCFGHSCRSPLKKRGWCVPQVPFYARRCSLACVIGVHLPMPGALGVFNHACFGTLILPYTRQRQTRWFTSGLSLTRVLSWISAKPIVYRLFSILNSDLIHNNLCFYNVWIYSRSHSATRIIRAACYRKFYFDFPSPLLAYSPLAKPAWVPLTQLIPLFHTRIHTFNIVSLLLA